MRGFRSLVLLMVPALGGALLTGCASEPVKAPPPAPVIVPASPQEASEIQADFSKLDPNVRVGHVSVVNTSAMMAVIEGIPAEAVKKGESIQFMDGRQMGIANGTISSIDMKDPANPYVIVDYTPTASGRAPVRGDLAFHLPG